MHCSVVCTCTHSTPKCVSEVRLTAHARTGRLCSIMSFAASPCYLLVFRVFGCVSRKLRSPPPQMSVCYWFCIQNYFKQQQQHSKLICSLTRTAPLTQRGADAVTGNTTASRLVEQSPSPLLALDSRSTVGVDCGVVVDRGLLKTHKSSNGITALLGLRVRSSIQLLLLLQGSSRRLVDNRRVLRSTPRRLLLLCAAVGAQQASLWSTVVGVPFIAVVFFHANRMDDPLAVRARVPTGRVDCTTGDGARVGVAVGSAACRHI